MFARLLAYICAVLSYVVELVSTLTSQCNNLGFACDFRFWILRVLSIFLLALIVVVLASINGSQAVRSWFSRSGRYQNVMLVLNVLVLITCAFPTDGSYNCDLHFREIPE